MHFDLLANTREHEFKYYQPMAYYIINNSPFGFSETPWPNSSQTDNASDSCNHFKYLAYTITYSVMFPFGLFSNSIALFVFLRYSPRKSASTVFMTNLAISDVCFSTTLPFRLIYYFKECHWTFWDWLCRWCTFAFYVNIYTSVLFLTGLSVLRYLVVVHPMRSRTIVTVRRAKFACFGIWVFVALSSIPFLMSGTIKKGKKTHCFEPGNWKTIYQINYLALALGFLIPFIIILGCYGCIIRSLCANRKVQKHKRKRQRSVYLIAVILSTFLLSFAPYHVVRTLHLHAVIGNQKKQEYLLKVLVITLCMATSNSCLNPLLYYFAGENFRASIQQASRRLTMTSFTDSFRERRNRSGQRGSLATNQTIINNNQKKQQVEKLMDIIDKDP
ncbi:cysteinyl leukotriene receptor 2 [Trichomycterus rosablanca]|uniref:cysteinyl leukotriene receptor 2 n=1 Tax=Trichomycterus rosablanca TaxID=2290929 RepID=UPI002F360DC0